MISQYLTDMVTEQLFNDGPAIDTAAQYYLAVFVNDPGVLGTGTEASGGSYARQPITFEEIDGDWFNDAPIVFNLASGSYYYLALYDASTGGNLISYGSTQDVISLVGAGTQTVPLNAVRFAMT